jgi:hypothetical protein
VRELTEERYPVIYRESIMTTPTGRPEDRARSTPLDISLKAEACLAAKAQEQGLSIDAFLERLPNDASDLRASTANGEAPQLPVWHLGVHGSLHRRDIYDDAD